ncbi:hypothetical protein L484_026557 [Morus notabilis]|uniref:Uncharacterized protein n=1 Tax=Morus notabilis TaxID=981085 RepID=W9QWK6_9ROSA|nr:hypothetical protein L484_026557 [Morus notabilis]
MLDQVDLFGLFFPSARHVDCTTYSACSNQMLGLFGLFFSISLLRSSARPVRAVLSCRPIWPVQIRCSAYLGCSSPSACSDQVFGLFFPVSLLSRGAFSSRHKNDHLSTI